MCATPPVCRRGAARERRQLRGAAEGALVDEPQLRVAVGEVEAGVQVVLDAARSAGLDEELAAHAQMDDEAA